MDLPAVIERIEVSGYDVIVTLRIHEQQASFMSHKNDYSRKEIEEGIYDADLKKHEESKAYTKAVNAARDGLHLGAATLNQK